MRMKPQKVRLFIKPGCPWCDEATEMKRLTGQTRAPTLDVDGHILADFGAQELDVWWLQMGFEE